MEDSTRQGSGFSAILYGQHAGKTIEKCEEKELGTKMVNQHVPAIGWQDDITILASDNTAEKNIISSIMQTTNKRGLYFQKKNANK